MELMLGNEAVARGAWQAGVRVATAYPGTPSTEITENIASYTDVYSEWSPNEKVALEVAIGASMGGARSICCMKHVGVNVAADPLFTAAYTGVRGGLVIIVADDPGMHSSQNEQDSRFYARSAHVPMLEPANSAECLEYTKKAFEISERYDMPVFVRLVTRVAHSRSLVDVGERTEQPLCEYVKDVPKYVMMPSGARVRHLVVEAREDKLLAEVGSLGLNSIEWAKDRTVGVICSGSAYNYVKEALPNASVLKLGIVYPLDEAAIKEFASGVETLYVIEELEPFFEDAIKAMGIKVDAGKDRTGLQGELFTRKIAHLFCGEEDAGPAETIDVPARPPVLCPGCPHRGLFNVLKKMKLTVVADIGCYTLGALPPLNAVDSVVCMGASVGMAHGFEKARGSEAAKQTVAVIGDSTFVHSGITGLVNVVYNHGHSVVIIADNSTTGMTGHQPNPTTGYDIHGMPSPQLSLEKLCEAIGVKRVRAIDPFKQKELEAILKEELAADEPSVIITRRPCVLLSKERLPTFAVDDEKCIKCGICSNLGCPAISKAEDKTVHIDDTLCRGCALCASVCPQKAINHK